MEAHPVTGQLSSLLPTILGWRRPGKIGNANIEEDVRKNVLFLLLLGVRDGSAFRDRSVKLVSSHTILGGPTCPGKIGNANIEEDDRKVVLFLFSAKLQQCNLWLRRFQSKLVAYSRNICYD